MDTPGVRRRALRSAALAGLTPAGLAAPPFQTPSPITGALYDLGGAAHNVRAYGARGDASAEDTPAIQAAIAAASAAGGGIVLFPAGAYAIGRTLLVTANGVTLIGAGPAATTIIPTWPTPPADPDTPGPPDADVIAFRGAANQPLVGGGVRMLAIAAPAPRAAGCAVRLTHTTRIIMQDVDLRHMYVGCRIDGTGTLQYLARCAMDHFAPGGCGVWIDVVSSETSGGPGGNDQYLSHLSIDNPEDPAQQPYAGIRIQNSQSVWATACDVLSCRHGLAVDPRGPAGGAPAGVVTWLFFQGCAFDTCWETGMLIAPQDGAVCRGLNFTDCWTSSTQTGDGCSILGPVDGVQLTGHRFLNNQGSGLSARAPARNVFVDASIAAGNGASGLSFQGVSDFAVRNSRSGATHGFGSSQPYGVAVGPGCRQYVLTGNILTGNRSGGLLDQGSPPKVVANSLSG